MYCLVLLLFCAVLSSAKIFDYRETQKYNDLEPKKSLVDSEIFRKIFLGKYDDGLWVMDLDSDGLDEVKLRPGTQAEEMEFDDLYKLQIQRYKSRQRQKSRRSSTRLSTEPPNILSPVQTNTKMPEVPNKKLKKSKKVLESDFSNKKKSNPKMLSFKPTTEKAFIPLPSTDSPNLPSSAMPMPVTERLTSKLPSSGQPETSLPNTENSSLLRETDDDEEETKREIMEIVNKFVLSADTDQYSNTVSEESGDEYKYEPSLTLYFRGPYSALTVIYNDDLWDYFITPPSPLPRWFYEDLPKKVLTGHETYVKPPKEVEKDFYKKFLRLVQVFLGHPV